MNKLEEEGKVNGNGMTQQSNEYSVTDYTIDTGTIYYRLQQVDVDGSSVFSKIIALGEESNSIQIYPNPFDNKTIIYVSSSDKMALTVKITSVSGAELYSSKDHFTNEKIE